MRPMQLRLQNNIWQLQLHLPLPMQVDSKFQTANSQWNWLSVIDKLAALLSFGSLPLRSLLEKILNAAQWRPDLDEI